MEYELVRSRRKTLAIEIKPDGRIMVRVPLACSRETVQAFIEKQLPWIDGKLKEQAERAGRKPDILTEQEQQDLIRQARIVFPARVDYFARQMKVDYGTVTIRGQKTRWGSCSAKGNLNFNWKLMLAPEPVLDYVVVHELAHRKQMNHSKAFYQAVAEIMPDYQKQQQWLKENGWRIL